MKLFIFMILFFSTLQGLELNWLNSYNTALKQAQREHKGVYLFVGADNCRWCERFKKLTLSDDYVIKKLKEDYVLLYMSRDRDKIPSKFVVRGVPRHYFLTSEGCVIHADRGSREVAGFLELLEEVDLKKSD